MPLIRARSAISGTIALFALALGSLAQQPAPSAAASARLQSGYARLSLAFEPNRGQTDAQVQFLARTPQATVFLTGADAMIQTNRFTRDTRGQAQLAGSASIRMHLAGAQAGPASTEQPLTGTSNYLRGNDVKQWQQNIPTFGGVRLAQVYPGVDLRYHGRAGQLEYDFFVAPGADAAAIRLQFQGATARVEANGDLLLPMGHGEDLRFDKPVAYQTIDGRQVPVQASFQLAANQDVSFQLGAYDHTRELVIDPTLIYLGTLASGIGQTNVSQITVDSAGALYFIGTTNETSFPTTTGAYQPVCGPANATAAANNITYCSNSNYTSAFVTKLSADGTKLVYSTFLSGHGGVETGNGIAVDSAGVAYLFGATGSDDFPVTSDAFQKSCYAFSGAFGTVNPVKCDGYYNGGGTQYTIGNIDGFFAKLNATGSTLVYSSFLGGAQQVYPSAIGLDGSGNIYLYGQTTELTALSMRGNLGYTGTTSSGFQIVSTAITPGNTSGTYNINNAPFLSKFSNDGHTLLYGTFFADNVSAIGMYPTAMTVSSAGIAYIGGYSQAINQNDTAGTLKTTCTMVDPNNGGVCTTYDGFLAAIDTTKSGNASLSWATRVGGSDTASGSNLANQQILGLTLDSSSNIYATGYTFDHSFPVGAGGYQSACPNYDATQSTYDYCDSAFLVKINPSGTKVLAGTFLNDPRFRSPESKGYNVRLDSKGQVYLYGASNDGAGNFPTVNPLQGYKGGNQLFIAAFSSDLSKLLFSTRFGNPFYTDHSVTPAGGMVLDSSDNIYFAGTTFDTMFSGTTGTYNTATAAGAGAHTFFAKVSKVLQPTLTTVMIPTTIVTAGNTFTLKATVAGTLQTTPVATGTVTFTYTNTTPAIVAGTATLDATGTATLTGPAPAAGTYTVVASYGADNTYDVSSSSAGSLTVSNPVTPAITLTPSPSAGKIDTKFTFTAALTSAAGTPTGTVYFMDGTTTLGSAVLTSGAASYSTLLAVGTHSITARYSGDGSFSAVSSTVQSVAVTLYGSSTTLSSSTASAVFGSSVTITATIATSGTTLVPSGTVTFLDGTTTLGTGTIKNGTATYTTSALAVGTHALAATYGGDTNFSSSTSSALTQTIVAASVALTASPTSLTITNGQTGTVTITATPTGALTGTVTFACGTLPQHTTCMFSPTSLVFSASAAAQTTTLSFATNTAALELPASPFSRRSSLPGAIAAGLFLPLGLLGLAGSRSRRAAARRMGLLLLVLAVSLGLAGLSGCGSAAPFNSTTAGTYSVPVTAMVNGGTSTLSLNITVQ